VQSLTTENGTVTTEPLSLVKGQEPYDEPHYLVETKAPDGYYILTEPLKVSIDLTDHNTSDWLQEATVKVTALDGTDSSSAIRVIPEGQHGITYDHTDDTTDASVEYMIVNNAGCELPYTGGPGTDLVYLLGVMLTGVAGAGLLMRWKKKTA